MLFLVAVLHTVQSVRLQLTQAYSLMHHCSVVLTVTLWSKLFIIEVTVCEVVTVTYLAAVHPFYQNTSFISVYLYNVAALLTDCSKYLPLGHTSSQSYASTVT